MVMSSALAAAEVSPVGAATPCPVSPYRSAVPVVIAHASSSHFGPPNTISMMRAAVRAGADVIDVDLRVTHDGELVASHDDDVFGLTGVHLSIAGNSLAALRRLDAGWSWPGPKRTHPLRGRGVRIPTAAEILTAFPGRRISFEFKTTGGERSLCRLLRATKRTDDAYVGSAGDAAVDRFKPLCPEVTTTVTDAMVVEFRAAQANGSSWCAPVPIGQPPFYRDNEGVLSADSVRWSHDHGLAIYTWTIDDPADLATVARLGVDGVYTGRPDLARAAFGPTRPVSRGR